MIAAPGAAADDYIDLLHGDYAVAPPAVAAECEEPPPDLVEEAGEHSCRCCCTVCLQTLVRSGSPASDVPDKTRIAAPSAAFFPDSSYYPEIFRPPSV